MYVESGYTGSIGAVAAGAATYLTFSATVTALNVYVGQKTGQAGNGSPRVFIDSANVTTATLYHFDSAGTGTETYYPCTLLKGTWTLGQLSGGSVGLAVRPGETGTLTAGSISADGNPSAAPALYLGTGATVTRLDAATGTVLNRSSNTTVTLNLDGNADYTHEGTGAHTTASVYGNAVYTDKGSGGITTLNLGGKYMRRATSAHTIGTLNLYKGATFDKNSGKTGITTVSAKALTNTAQQDVKIYGPVGEFL